MTFEIWFHSHHPHIPMSSVATVLGLSADGATIPFMARYRKEQTGNLDEVAIKIILDEKERWDLIVNRQSFITGEIERQGKLSPELKEKIAATFDLTLLEDLYLPYKQKRKTKAALAKEAGLQEFADWLWNCGHGTETPQPGQTLELWAMTFRNEEKGIADVAAVLEGAQHILIERLSEMQDLRQRVRDHVFKSGQITTAKGKKAKEHSKFEPYFNYHESIASLLEPKNSHRYLAIRRGWMEEELTLSIGGKPDQTDAFDAPLLAQFEAAACSDPVSPGAEILLRAARLALKASVLPSIENEVHKALKAVADDAAIAVFSENMRKLLLASPFGAKAVLGIDPGIRTGCKIAVVDDSGKYIASTVIHLQSDAEKEKAKAVIAQTVQTAAIRAIAVGNGTAGRETESFVRAALKDAAISIPVVMVSEAGASVYSASDIAREEFPDLDVTVRGAISIARRLQDPLAELVKTDPKSIGVGQYQHDVSQNALKKSLEFVVDSCVNAVGINVNTASPYLLSRVSGIGDTLAKAIVEHRNLRGVFKNRSQLLEVPRFSKKAFEQAAGFLRIPEGDYPLDTTGVHPERYPALEKLAARLNKKIEELMGPGVQIVKQDSALAEEVGTFTFQDIIAELEKPGRDPRDEFVPFSFRDDIHTLADLKTGLICPGIVTNVTNFGAFVDIGVHQDGLVHISQLGNQFVKDPRTLVNPGDRVTVRVIDVNLEKKQIALSMKMERLQHQERQEQRRAPFERDQDHRRVPSRQDPHRSRDNSRRPPMPPRRPAPPPKPVFNNAFAVLKELKLKSP